MIQDWVLIENVDILNDVANRIASTRRIVAERPTALGYALGYSAGLLARAPVCAAQTIDVSGDGLNNDGFEPRQAYDVFDLNGVTVNGLVIEEPDDAAFRIGQIDLPSYYEQELIQGPAAFVEIADGFEDFARTMEVKLIRELDVLMLGQNGQPTQGTDG
jgi:hypothetical protein